MKEWFSCYQLPSSPGIGFPEPFERMGAARPKSPQAHFFRALVDGPSPKMPAFILQGLKSEHRESETLWPDV